MEKHNPIKKFITIIFFLILAAINLQAQSCFTRNWTGSGLDQMNFYITKATVNGVNLQIGDEIGVFDGTSCVGVGVLTQILSGGTVYLAIVTSKDDPDTPAKDGYTSGNPVSYRLCANGATVIITDIVTNYTSGSGVFSIGGTVVVELTGTASVPIAPIVGTITQPSCAVPTGTVVLGGLPSTGSWTLTRTPGSVTYPGSGIIYTVSGLDPGTYIFTVTNNGGFTSPSSGNVVINAQPVKPNQPGPITGNNPVCQGSSQTYSISLVSGATSYIWALPSGWSGSSASISISVTTGINAGSISVAASNSCGTSIPRTMNIGMFTKPSVTTSNVSDATLTTAVGGGDVTSDGGSDLSEIGVCWSTTANPTINDSRSSDGTSTGPFVSTLTGLADKVTYHIRAYATNCAGTGYGSDIEYFHTSTGTENIQKIEISAFPNPVTGILNIEYNSDIFKSINIKNSQGELMEKLKVISPRQQIDFSKFEYGLYFLEFVKQDGETKRLKVIKP